MRGVLMSLQNSSSNISCRAPPPPLFLYNLFHARRLRSWGVFSHATQQILEEHKYLHPYKIVVHENWPFYGRLTVFLLIEMRSSLALSCSAESEIPSFLKRTPMAAMRCLGASEMMTSVWAATHWSLLSPPTTWCMSTWHDCNNRTGTVKLWWWHSNRIHCDVHFFSVLLVIEITLACN